MQKSYIRTFEDERTAMDWMRLKNRATRVATRRRDLFAVVPGPDDNFAVVDLDTAIGMGCGFKWEA